MILIDTSAWIISFKKSGNQELKDFLANSIASGNAATCPPVILELLQGCRTEKQRDDLRSRLDSLEVFDITHSVWESSYELGFSLRRKGLTIPSTDLIISATALQNNCQVLHHDWHYELVAQNHRRLRTRSFL
jgi:predicted nucleic acid-binding protein